MYDARGSQSGGSNSNLMFGLITIAVIGIAFFGILLMPSGNKSAPVQLSETSAQDSETLIAGLDDPTTQRFLNALNVVSPEFMTDMQTQARKAIARGDSRDDVTQMVMQAYVEELPRLTKYIAKADVAHFDKMLNHTKGGLRQMQSGNGKWCKGATYEKFATMRPAQLQAMMQREFAYGSDGYKWAIGFNALMLEAAADGKANPQTYGAMTSRDEAAMQGVMIKMIADPQVLKLMQLQGASKAEMARATKNLDFCGLGISAINALGGLPKDTRGRMWGEMFRKMNSRDFQRQMQMMNGGGLGMLGGS